MQILTDVIGFDWDQGNKGKNFIKHQATDEECEEVFFDPQKKILKDVLHSGNEERYVLLGKTKIERLLFIVFTIRKQKIRIISARDINNKEKKLYQ